MTEAIGDGVQSTPVAVSSDDVVPAYLRKTYAWAYLWPGSIRLLDRRSVVSAILWGNYDRLRDLALDEVPPGSTVLQPACVYGDFSPCLADHIGGDGKLVVADVAPQQVENCRRKLASRGNVALQVRDAATHPPAAYDAVCCFFLLHELPDAHKRRVVDGLLAAVRPGGKAVFVDYHAPHPAHPLRPVMSLVFDLLEPFAKTLWRRQVRDLATRADAFVWEKQLFFGGLYQKTVARRPAEG